MIANRTLEKTKFVCLFSVVVFLFQLHCCIQLTNAKTAYTLNLKIILLIFVFFAKCSGFCSFWSLVWCILKSLFPSVSVLGGRVSPVFMTIISKIAQVIIENSAR